VIIIFLIISVIVEVMDS